MIQEGESTLRRVLRRVSGVGSIAVDIGSSGDMLLTHPQITRIRSACHISKLKEKQKLNEGTKICHTIRANIRWLTEPTDDIAIVPFSALIGKSPPIPKILASTALHDKRLFKIGADPSVHTIIFVGRFEGKDKDEIVKWLTARARDRAKDRAASPGAAPSMA